MTSLPFSESWTKTPCGNKPKPFPGVMEVQLPCGSVSSSMARAGCNMGWWLQILPVHPKNPSQGWVSVLAASLCCLSTVPPHSTLCSMDLFGSLFSWSSCKFSLSTEGFALTLFSIHLYMCSPIDLHLLVMLCPFEKYDLYPPCVAELFREAVVRCFTTHPVRLYFCQVFSAIWGSLCYFQWLFIYFENPVLEIARCFSSLWDLKKKKYYLFLYHTSSLQLWFHSLSNKLYMELYKLCF